MSTYNERKIFLQQSIIGYHDLEGVSGRIEKEIYIGCAIMVAKTLRSMSELDQIKDEYYSITRIIKLAEWLIKHIKDEKQKVATMFLRNIKEKQENENEKLKKLQYLYDLAIRYVSTCKHSKTYYVYKTFNPCITPWGIENTILIVLLKYFLLHLHLYLCLRNIDYS